MDELGSCIGVVVVIAVAVATLAFVIYLIWPVLLIAAIVGGFWWLCARAS